MLPAFRKVHLPVAAVTRRASAAQVGFRQAWLPRAEMATVFSDVPLATEVHDIPHNVGVIPNKCFPVNCWCPSNGQMSAGQTMSLLKALGFRWPQPN